MQHRGECVLEWRMCSTVGIRNEMGNVQFSGESAVQLGMFSTMGIRNKMGECAVQCGICSTMGNVQYSGEALRVLLGETMM